MGLDSWNLRLRFYFPQSVLWIHVVSCASCWLYSVRRQHPVSVVGEEAFGLPTLMCVCFPPVVFYWLSCRQETWNELALSLSSNLLPMGTLWNTETHALLSVFREKHLTWELWTHLPCVARLPNVLFPIFQRRFIFLMQREKSYTGVKKFHTLLLCVLCLYLEKLVFIPGNR